MRRTHLTSLLWILAVGLTVGCARAPRARPIVWDRLPFPKDSDWSAPKGAPPKIENGVLVLQSQAVRTRSSYAVPVTVQCEVVLEDRSMSDGEFAVKFLATGQPKDVELREFVQFRMIFRNLGAYSGRDGLVIEGRGDSLRSNQLWGEQPFTVNAGQPYRITLDVLPDRMRIDINGQKFDAVGVTVPYERFQIQLDGRWPRWHVRSFTVR